MNKIETGLKLDFNNVLIRPKRSTLNSRSEITLHRRFKFINAKIDNNPIEWYGTPVISANMDSTGTFEVYDILSKHNIITALHKFYSSEQLIECCNKRQMDPNLFMIPENWTPSLHGSNNTAYEVRIPLTIEDTTSQPSEQGWGSRGRTIPLPNGFNIDSDAARTNLEFKNAFGFSVSFATMVPYEFGDTMEARDGSEITNKINYFGHSMYINNSVMVPQTKYCNNSWWVPGEIGYGGDQNGWENAIPGNAYFQDRYINYAVHITTDALGTEELNNNITFGLYPNPVQRSEYLKVDFNLVNASNVNIQLHDLLGNKVKEITNDYFTSGEHKTDVNISDLDAGMYVFTIKAGNAVSSKKVTIID